MNRPGAERSPIRFGKYEVTRHADGKPMLLGSGSTGSTYKATHSLLGTTVALKVVHENLAGDPEVRQRFLNEARAVACLKHGHIAQMVDCDEADGVLFYAMEYCDGGDLEQLAAKHGPLPEETVLHLARQAAGALAYVHSQGYLHRDLKPSNLMLAMVPGREEANLKLIDFGLVKSLHQASGLTQRGQFRGTLLYTSPEQLREETLDERADVFSLGVTMWFLLEGKMPLRNHPEEISQQRRSGQNMGQLVAKRIHPAVRALLTEMMQPEPGKRVRNMQIVLAGIEECLTQMQRSGHRGREAPKFEKVQEDARATRTRTLTAPHLGTTTRASAASRPATASAPATVGHGRQNGIAQPAAAPGTNGSHPAAATRPPSSISHTRPATAGSTPAPHHTQPPLTRPPTQVTSASPAPASPPPRSEPVPAPPRQERPAQPSMRTLPQPLNSKFDLLEEMDDVHGDLGRTFLARRSSSGDLVQLTRVQKSLAVDSEVMKNLQHTVGAATQYQGIFLVKPYSLIQFSDHLALIEELVDGLSLLSILKTRQKLPLLEAAGILVQLAEACDQAGAVGLGTLDLAPHRLKLQFPHMMGARINSREAQKLMAMPLPQWPAYMVRVVPEYEAAFLGSEADLPCTYARLIYHMLSGMPVNNASMGGRIGYISGLGEEANRLLGKVVSGEMILQDCYSLITRLWQLESLPMIALQDAWKRRAS